VAECRPWQKTCRPKFFLPHFGGIDSPAKRFHSSFIPPEADLRPSAFMLSPPSFPECGRCVQLFKGLSFLRRIACQHQMLRLG
jgi:hypothetical protein